ncbi:MAG: DUF4234 domain-containing protein [Pseudomonadota bacterium]|uniref:DUF4234 domain-containing protein n=1 Tax=Providencia TaxID=586 RepID=UPI0024B1ACD5
MPDFDSLSKKLNTPTLQFVLLTLLTAGLYPFIWLYKTSQLIESETQQQAIHPYYYLALLALCGWELLLGDAWIVASVGEGIYEFSSVLSKICMILLIVWSFKAKRLLQIYYLKNYGIDIKPNTFYTLIFGVYYINFLINSLADIQEREMLIQAALAKKESLTKTHNETQP